MKKYFMSLMLLPSFAFAGASIGYTHIDAGSGVNLGAVEFAYAFESDSDFQFEVGAHIGVKDWRGLELDPSYNVKGIYNFNEQFFALVNYYHVKTNIGSSSDVGFGVGTNLSENWALIYENVDDVDFLTIRYRF